MYFYQRLRDLREDADRSQSDVAKYLGMKYQQYARYENGERELPLHHAVALAKYYNISLDYIVGLTSIPKKLK